VTITGFDIGTSSGALLGVESVQEFQVLTNSFSAEFGQAAGGMLNVITRSGANRTRASRSVNLHGLAATRIETRSGARA
jgi:outer membrane receptor for ferrienterochelin and colicin